MKRYWDQMEIGDSIPKNARPPISRLQIAQFAAAADEFSPLNLDDEEAKNAGFHSVYAPGLMSLGFIEEALRSFASNMRIVALKGTFQRLIWPGDTLFPQGLLVRRYKKNQEHRVVFSLWCENQNDEIVMKGSALCILFKNAEDEQVNEQDIPPISEQSMADLSARCSDIMGIAKAKLNEEERVDGELV